MAIARLAARERLLETGSQRASSSDETAICIGISRLPWPRNMSDAYKPSTVTRPIPRALLIKVRINCGYIIQPKS